MSHENPLWAHESTIVLSKYMQICKYCLTKLIRTH